MATQENTIKKPVKGSCLCGHISYTALIPTGEITANRCNCAFCRKRGMTTMRVSRNEFTLHTPASQSEVEDYSTVKKGSTGSGHRYFCATCGVHVWMEAKFEVQGHEVDFFALNMATIDQPQEGIDLSEVKINYADGLHDNFMTLSDKPWSGGLI